MQLPRDVPALFFDDSRMGDSDRIRVSWPTKRVRRRRLRRVTACWIDAGSTKQRSTGCETQHVDRNMDEWRDLLWLWGRRCDARMRSISNAAHNGELENSIEQSKCWRALAAQNELLFQGGELRKAGNASLKGPGLQCRNSNGLGEGSESESESTVLERRTDGTVRACAPRQDTSPSAT